MPDQLPELSTQRLRLRAPDHPGDARQIGALAADRAIADTTLSIPHPYTDADAVAWMAHVGRAWRAGREAVWVVTTVRDGIVGGIGLILDAPQAAAELGYWIGVPHAGRGYATEAARAVLAFGFGQLGLRRIQARHFSRNPASGRILQKVGMRREGVFRHHIIKWGVPEDVVVWAALREDNER